MEEEAQVLATCPSTAPASCWSNVVKNPQTPKTHQQESTQASRILVDTCNSSKGISVAVVDANAVIDGGEKLTNCADKFVSVEEVLHEIRDPVSRHRLSFLPFPVETMEPSPEALKKVVKFARETGDLQTLSDVDLKLIALTYTLEAQIHGTKHLRDRAPPTNVVNVKKLPEKDLPGWGSNVPNLDEWEALENEVEEKSNDNSRILPLRDLNLNVISLNDHSESVSTGQTSEVPFEILEESEKDSGKARRFPPKKNEVKIEGRKMVANGIDASQGDFDDATGDWMPVVSRSTHRRYLRRKAKREYYDALSQTNDEQQLEENTEAHVTGDVGGSKHVPDPVCEDACEKGVPEEDDVFKETEHCEELSGILNQMRLETDESGVVDEGSYDLESETLMSETVDTSYVDDNNSEQSWTLRSLSESSVACITGDFAMQNVLLQMGLRLLAPGGSQIHQLHRWILRCHACYNVTAEIGRLFCPKCGNGGTLRKVAITVGENGIVLAARRPRITLRGTRFSLPLPKGGRDAVTKNAILREDQLPQKFLYPKTKKITNKQDDHFFTQDSIFSQHSCKKASFQPPVRKALAVFSGKRNPNDNHYSRSKRK